MSDKSTGGKVLGFLTAKRQDPFAHFEGLCSDLEEALAAGRPSLVLEVIGDTDKEQFGRSMAEFLQQIGRLPTDDPRCQPWTALYTKARRLREQALTILATARQRG